MKKYIKSRIRSFFTNVINKIISESIVKRNLTFFILEESLRKSAQIIIDKGKFSVPFTSKFLLYDYIIDQKLITGDFCEFGVWKGESINYFSSRVQDKQIRFYGFDSFEGLPEDWRFGFSKGEFDLNGKKPIDTERITFIKGWFADTIPNFLKEYQISEPIFLHIDCDLYSSTKDVFNCLSNLIRPNSYILFDELLAYPGFLEHEYLALIEFLKSKNLDYEIIGFNTNHEQVLVRII